MRVLLKDRVMRIVIPEEVSCQLILEEWMALHQVYDHPRVTARADSHAETLAMEYNSKILILFDANSHAYFQSSFAARHASA